MIRKLYNFLSSAKLAMALLVVILACCVAGVTVYRGPRAWTLIFNALWFNGLLTLLVLNVGFCFFGRIWGRRVTLVSLGMILFHLSFIAVFSGIIYNSLFYFRGLIRLTEGETLASGDPLSYDFVDQGRFFSYSTIKGETTLIQMHRDYKIDEQNKRAAYEIEVGSEGARKHGIIYITKSLENRGFTYFNEAEGYSVLVILHDKLGGEVYGAFVSLQSLKQPDESFVYTSGSKDGPDYFKFPAEPAEPLFFLQVQYIPAVMTERSGSVVFKLLPLEAEKEQSSLTASDESLQEAMAAHSALEEGTTLDLNAEFRHGSPEGEEGNLIQRKPIAEGEVAIGEKFELDEYDLTVGEVRYWVTMNVRYEPGKPIVLTSLWVGLVGMVLTFVGRMRRR